jgi:hypothetical protein
LKEFTDITAIILNVFDSLGSFGTNDTAKEEDRYAGYYIGQYEDKQQTTPNETNIRR